MRDHTQATDATRLDPAFRDELLRTAGAKELRACFSCNTCTASCPVRKVEEKFNPRRFVRMGLLGLKDRLLRDPSIWLCTTCYTCAERCPQGVKICDVMHALKNLATKYGHPHPAYKAQAKLIGTFGRLYEIEDFDNRRRKKLGLPVMLTACPDVAKIFEKGGLSEIFDLDLGGE